MVDTLLVRRRDAFISTALSDFLHCLRQARELDGPCQ